MQLADAIAAYAAGLETELELLRRVQALAREQRDCVARDHLAGLGGVATRRAALMNDLADAEARIAPFRERILAQLAEARRHAGFALADALGREAQALVRDVVDHDRAFLSDLEATLEHRRLEAHALDTGGATLAAYRRVVAPPPAHANLVDQRG
jgi:hypothetical protein